MSLAELEWLQARASEMESVVEVGALHGRSTTALLEGCPGTVYSIDPWNDPGDHCYRSFMASCGHYPNLVDVRGTSPAVIATHHLPDVDMVFLDGAHDAASVQADIDGWAPKCRRLICGHDYINDPGASYPDVAAVVNATYGDRVRVAPDTAIWYVDLDDGR